jgi:serine/threonine protein kinase
MPRQSSDTAPTQERPDSASSSRFSLASGEQALTSVRTELPDLEAGAERYESGPVLGEGGMGVVHLRRDRATGRYVAQKTLHPDAVDKRTQRRFVREARAQAQLEHPAIVPVYDLGRDPQGGVFFTMKRVRGHTLARVIEGLADHDPDYVARYPRRRLLSAFVQVCRAIHYAHARHVLHRDLKPSNVMLGDFGEVYVLDWGLARILDEAPLDTVTVSAEMPAQRTDAVDMSRATVDDGTMAGTPAYMAPEQLDSDKPMDARSDVYTLGVVLYEVLALKRFRGQGSLVETAVEILDARVAHPAEIDPDIDPELDAVCARATAIRPEDRFQSAGEMADTIERVLDGEHDAEVRASAAARLVASARESLASDDVAGRSQRQQRAMHDLLRAVTLDPSASEARALLVSLLSDASEIPPGAHGDIRTARAAHRREGAWATIVGMIAWLLPVPIVLSIVPVLSWPVMGVAIGGCIAVALVSYFSQRAGNLGPSAALFIAALISVIIVAISSLLGPFVIVPTAGATATMFFAMYVSRRERLIATGMFTIAVLLPFALDALGWVPPGFAIEGNQVTLFARSIALPPEATVLALAWSSGSFTVLAAWMTGRMHDRLEHAEDRLLVSAWHLRQLFAPEGAAPAK